MWDDLTNAPGVGSTAARSNQTERMRFRMADKRICSIEGCYKPYVARGYCHAHYALFKRNGTPAKVKVRGTCSVEGCGKPHFGLGWCRTHHERYRVHGTVDLSCTPNGAPKQYLLEVALAYTGAECLRWPYGNLPYGTIFWDGQSRNVHRILCELAHGQPPTDEHQAAHNCGNSRCCNPMHLRWATPLENSNDTLLHGTRARGGRIHNTKLTEADVRAIRLAKGTKSINELAQQFGVSRGAIRGVHSRKNWRWLP